MKYEETQKITALGVVIFSFLSILLCIVIIGVIDALTVLFVLKTSLPETVLKVGSVLAGGAGLIISTAILTAKGRVRGIVAAGIMAGVTILIKIIGNSLMNLGGYLNWLGFAGLLFTIVFAFSGGILGTVLKR